MSSTPGPAPTSSGPKADAPGPSVTKEKGRPFTALPLADRLRLRDLFLRGVRHFFVHRGYTEVETPVRVASPGIDPYIDAIEAGDGRFLATSPELEMKKLLARGMERIFQITRAFRAEEQGIHHQPEFAILEWYARGETYVDLMETTEALVRESAEVLIGAGLPPPVRRTAPFRRMTVDEAFLAHAGWKPSEDFEADAFFFDLVDKVEPGIKGQGAVFLTDYPEPVGALARKKPDDTKVCERFELYLDGLEICNGFTELTDSDEQRERFARDNGKRESFGKRPYPVDEDFLAALASGIPPCAGNALGLDRLFLSLTGSGALRDVTLLVDSEGE